MPKTTEYFGHTLDEWFRAFDKMKPGSAIEIKKFAKDDPKTLIDIGKMFIDAGNMDYEFTNDYKYFKRINSY
jgi:hypothetical protein